jgi:hypothetical protein
MDHNEVGFRLPFKPVELFPTDYRSPSEWEMLSHICVREGNFFFDRHHEIFIPPVLRVFQNNEEMDLDAPWHVNPQILTKTLISLKHFDKHTDLDLILLRTSSDKRKIDDEIIGLQVYQVPHPGASEFAAIKVAQASPNSIHSFSSQSRLLLPIDGGKQLKRICSTLDLMEDGILRLRMTEQNHERAPSQLKVYHLEIGSGENIVGDAGSQIADEKDFTIAHFSYTHALAVSRSLLDLGSRLVEQKV